MQNEEQMYYLSINLNHIKPNKKNTNISLVVSQS